MSKGSHLPARCSGLLDCPADCPPLPLSLPVRPTYLHEWHDNGLPFLGGPVGPDLKHPAAVRAVAVDRAAHRRSRGFQ